MTDRPRAWDKTTSEDLNDRERIIDAFFRTHEEVYPDEADVRATLRDEKLERLQRDADALLRFSLSVDTVCSIIARDMRRRPGLRMTSPSTIRFCVKSIEKLAQIGNSAPRRQVPPPPAFNTAACAAMMSKDDHHRIRKQIVDLRYSSLTLDEKARWVAYMAAWREAMGFKGPPPLEAPDPTLLSVARQIYSWPL